jgi:protein-disulfide isomerase
MRYAALVLAVAVLGLAPISARAEDAKTTAAPAMSSAPVVPKDFSDNEKAEIKEIVKQYLIKEHPEVIMMAAQELEKRQAAFAQDKSEQAISKQGDKLFKDPNTPVGGNPKGDVTVVEFFDYNCGYCKMSQPAVEKLLKADSNIKFLYKDYPILGPESITAAKASFAAARQGKYVEFHDNLMNKKDHMSEDLIYQVAKDTGLDVDKLKKDMADEAIEKMIEDNVQLGTDVGVRGTPMFIINGEVFPGAMPYEQIKKAVDDARAKKSPSKG